MSRPLQSLLFFVLIAGMLLALWSWSGRGPEPMSKPISPRALEQAPQARSPATAPADSAIEPSGRSDDVPSAERRSDADPLPQSGPSPPLPEFLPPEAIDTLRLIVRNGPFPYRQDGGVFQNRERRLPQQPRGYYREYTVETPGSPDRGARRIVTGGEVGDGLPLEYHYTADHYRSFRRFEIDPAALEGEGRPR